VGLPVHLFGSGYSPTFRPVVARRSQGTRPKNFAASISSLRASSRSTRGVGQEPHQRLGPGTEGSVTSDYRLLDYSIYRSALGRKLIFIFVAEALLGRRPAELPGVLAESFRLPLPEAARRACT
jgi:hypothetical protein